jgi:ribosomal protein S18 acetylase RimI-like enzyme
MDLQLRDAVDEDLPSLQRVFRFSSLSNEGDREALLEHPEALAYSGTLILRRRCRVATVPSGRIVGFAATSPGAGALELEDLFVDPDWMRSGVGRMLMTDVLLFAKTAGVSRVEVDGNPHALSFYRTLGFVFNRIVQTEFGSGYRMHIDV